LLSEILKRTPFWVFILFFVLLAAGYLLTKDRTVSRAKLSILPIAMTGLSFSGVVSAFNFMPLSLACWAAGIGIAVMLGLKFGGPRGVRYTAETRSFFVPGSWLPLTLMMIVFFIKYVVAVILARRLTVAGDPAFIFLVSLTYGLLSGIFLSRSLVVRRAATESITPGQ
jgi:hypothetical protein